MIKSQEGRALRQFTLRTGKSAGRNSSGRITVFHRGGGSKRLQRRIDLKRSTSSLGIVERIEYDPNRSSQIAPVRWIEGARQRKCKTIEEFAPSRKILEPTRTTIRGLFSFSSPPGKVDQRKVACFSPGRMAPYVVVGLPTRMPPWSKSPFKLKDAERKKTGSPPGPLPIGRLRVKGSCHASTHHAKTLSWGVEAWWVGGVELLSHLLSPLPDGRAFLWKPLPLRGGRASFQSPLVAFPSPKAKGASYLSFGSSFGFPRIAVAGAKPAFFAPRMREKVRGKNTFSLCEVRKWRTHSILWAHRIKRKAALSWQSFRRQKTLGLVGGAEHNESKPETDQGSLPAKPIVEGPKDGARKVNRAPVV